MTGKLFFFKLYMTDVQDPEEVSYGDLFLYFDQIRGDHQPNPIQASNDDRSLSSRKKEKKTNLKPKPYFSPKRPRKKEIKKYTGAKKAWKFSIFSLTNFKDKK